MLLKDITHIRRQDVVFYLYIAALCISVQLVINWLTPVEANLAARCSLIMGMSINQLVDNFW